jgi:hypothetical protein
MTLVKYDISRHQSYVIWLLVSPIQPPAVKINPNKKENLEEEQYKHDEGKRRENELGSVLAWMIVSARSYKTNLVLDFYYCIRSSPKGWEN